VSGHLGLGNDSKKKKIFEKYLRFMSKNKIAFDVYFFVKVVVALPS
jgi:hypothetical protein